jgi:hypothetical protein
VIRVIPPAISLRDSCPNICIELLTLQRRFAPAVSWLVLDSTLRQTPLTTGKGCFNVADGFGDYCLRSAVLGGARIRPAHAAVRSESG